SECSLSCKEKDQDFPSLEKEGIFPVTTVSISHKSPLIPLFPKGETFGAIVSFRSASSATHQSARVSSKQLPKIAGRIRWRVCRSADLFSWLFLRQYSRTNRRRVFGRRAFVQH